MCAPSPDNKRLPLSSIFICSVFHSDSPCAGAAAVPGPHININNKKRMSFLVVHDIRDGSIEIIVVHLRKLWCALQCCTDHRNTMQIPAIQYNMHQFSAVLVHDE